MSERINSLSSPARSSSNLTANPYYEELQKNLKTQKEEAVKIQDQQSEAIAKADRERDAHALKQKESVVSSAKDEVSIGNSRWEKSKDGSYELKAQAKEPLLTSIDLKDDGKRILQILTKKIDFSVKLPQIEQALKQSMVQSKSPNFFLSKYAQFKVGVYVQLLAGLGMSSEDIKKLQKQAMEGAVSENILSMGENIYGEELTEILHGKTRKSRRTLGMYTEAQQQLTQQMALLGKPNYWNKARLYEEKLKQAAKIREEFKNQRDALAYQYEFLSQEIGR